MYYFIYAKEGMYEGLHGIYDYTLYDAASYEDACDTAEGMSRDVIDSYVRPEDVYYTQEDFCEEQGYDLFHLELTDCPPDIFYEMKGEMLQ